MYSPDEKGNNECGIIGACPLAPFEAGPLAAAEAAMNCMAAAVMAIRSAAVEWAICCGPNGPLFCLEMEK